jgi:6-phosphofructokinase
MGGLTVGAATVYIPETGINIHVLQKDIRHLCRRYEEDDRSKIPAEGRLILRNEMAGGDVYTTSVISNILKEEGHGSFDSRTSILGHLQQGGTPSPLDRIRATRMAVACVDWLQEIAFESRNKMTGQVYTQNMEHSTVLCIRGSKTVFAPVEHVKDYNDNSWWLGYSKMINVLAKYDYFENKA